ncbi:hypothetical protein OF83DRAFT_1166855 [Amylostereum chailletii]|nr:hypothetical protein OF83DRAFT_1166855 [Amylostereum chailletii]
MLDDIHTRYHPTSGRPEETAHFEDYRTRPAPASRDPPPSEPWSPFFKTREDFLIAQIMHEGALSEDKCDRLFERKTVSVPYKNETRDFDVHVRPLWGWLSDVLQDPKLAPYFEWDARQIFKYDGEDFVHIFHEPWTGDQWWKIQSNLPEGAVPLFILVYADKSRLSSFGSAKGYPVIARICNLPSDIRNGIGSGGGRVVGWLPIVDEDPAEAKKPGFANFKRVVWHQAFYEVLQSVIEASKTGQWFRCGVDQERHLFPMILILSADYEEQCFMSLIDGFGGKLPCPICLVPKDQLSDLHTISELRTATESQAIVKHARELPSDIFLIIMQNTDVHHALSFDRLHSYNSGLFGTHLWQQFKALVNAQGRELATEVDHRMSLVPRWRNLNHFDKVMNVYFNDGSKWEDISKTLIYAVANIFSRDTHPTEWLLLRCIRSYVNLDMYISLPVHMDHTLAAGEQELRKFGRLLKLYIEATSGSTGADSDDPESSDSEDLPGKNWKFPKVHLHQHVFDDIRAKGVTKNYNTKPNEKMHGPLKKAYLHRTNFKDFAPQILKVDHRTYCRITTYVSGFIQEQIEELDSYAQYLKDEEIEAQGLDDNADLSLPQSSRVFDAGNIILGSQQKPISLAALEQSSGHLPAFKDFQKRLRLWLIRTLPTLGVPMTSTFQLSPNHKVHEFRFVKTLYESSVDWRQTTDYLRCSPQFFGQERRDFVIVNTRDKGHIFARLLLVFTCSIGPTEPSSTPYPLALIHPLDTPLGPRRLEEKELELLRVRAKPPGSSEFISVKSIVRGAILVQDSKRAEDCFVMDALDGDMFLRYRSVLNQ